MKSENVVVVHCVPRNKGKLTDQEPPLRLREIWAIRTRLQMASNVGELAMLNLAIDSKLRAGDLTRMQAKDAHHGSQVALRATVLQQNGHTVGKHGSLPGNRRRRCPRDGGADRSLMAWRPASGRLPAWNGR